MLKQLPIRLSYSVMAAVVLVSVLVLATTWCHGWNAAVGAGDMPPTWSHPLGTDRLGRSVLDKMAMATPATIGVAVVGAIVATCLGTLIGAAAGMSRGWIDEAIVWCYTTVASIPGILLMIAMSLALSAVPAIATCGHAWLGMALALGLAGWVGTARLIRSEVLRRRDALDVEAARSLGLSEAEIWRVHILPSTTHIICIEFASHLASYIQAGVVLAFLGTGPTDALSWGALIDEGRGDLARGVWWQMVAATTAVLSTSIATHVIADHVRDRFDPSIHR